MMISCLFLLFFCRCNFGPCFHEYCGLRAALIWICQTLCGSTCPSVWPASCPSCLGTESIIPLKVSPTNTYISLYYYSTQHRQTKTDYAKVQRGPLFADGSKGSSLGQLQSRPAALYQEAERRGGDYYSYLQSWAYVERISVFNWAAKR